MGDEGWLRAGDKKRQLSSMRYPSPEDFYRVLVVFRPWDAVLEKETARSISPHLQEDYIYDVRAVIEHQ